jgi:hypothetical protein
LMFMAVPAPAQSARPDKMGEMIDAGGYRLHLARRQVIAAAARKDRKPSQQ